MLRSPGDHRIGLRLLPIRGQILRIRVLLREVSGCLHERREWGRLLLERKRQAARGRLVRRGAAGRLKVWRLLAFAWCVGAERRLGRVLVAQRETRLRPQELALGEADEER